MCGFRNSGLQGPPITPPSFSLSLPPSLWLLPKNKNIFSFFLFTICNWMLSMTVIDRFLVPRCHLLICAKSESVCTVQARKHSLFHSVCIVYVFNSVWSRSQFFIYFFFSNFRSFDKYCCCVPRLNARRNAPSLGNIAVVFQIRDGVVAI